MIRGLLCAIIGAVSVGSAAQSGGFQPLSMEAGKDTAVGQYSLRLADPDNADKPTKWQGPLTISLGSASCTADISLVTTVYATQDQAFVIVVSSSGSNAIAHFIELASCSEKWPPVKRAASSVRVQGNRLSFMPTCEGGGKNAPALCTSARVYAVHGDSPPTYFRLDSYRLTEKELGVGFVGEARVMNPHSSRAIVVH